jgi:glyoxylate utilization-related uncharacterized protein
LLSLKTDVVLSRENQQVKGLAYVFADAGVKMQMTTAKALSAAITNHKKQIHPLNGVKKG